MKPIGSIVYLHNGNQKVMIMNRGPIVQGTDTQVVFDYSGCLYPMGLNPDQILYFNEENIDRVIFKGYSDDDEERYQELYKEWEETEGKKYPKGDVKDPL